MKFLSTIPVVLVLFILTLTSCSKEEFTDLPISNETTSPKQSVDVYDLKVEDGTLVFESMEQMSAALNAVANLNTTERSNWETAIGFTSMHSQSQDFTAQAMQVESEDQIQTLLNVPADFNEAYLPIVNENGIFRINESMYYMAADRTVSIAENNPAKMERVKNATESNPDLGVTVNAVQTTELRAPGAPQLSCGSSKSGYDTGAGSRVMLGYTKLQTTDFSINTGENAGTIYYELRLLSAVASAKAGPLNEEDFSWSVDFEIAAGANGEWDGEFSGQQSGSTIMYSNERINDAYVPWGEPAAHYSARFNSVTFQFENLEVDDVKFSTSCD